MFLWYHSEEFKVQNFQILRGYIQNMDPKWEFNANQFVDFNNLEEQDNSNADEFFDVNMETGER